jgi:hypothetical protein
VYDSWNERGLEKNINGKGKWQNGKEMTSEGGKEEKGMGNGNDERQKDITITFNY